MKALVIDDNQSVRAFVERVLQEAGYETTSAKDGVHAQLLVLRYGPPDFVVTDQSMPRMSGHEFAHWVRGSFPAVKVLFLTGYAEQMRRSPENDWECVGYLEKPCSVRGLLQAVSLLMFKTLEPAPVTSRQPAAP